MSEVLDLGVVDPKEIQVKIGDKTYTLREATGDAVVRFNGRRAQAGRFEDGKFVGVSSNLADAEPFLVSLCLFDEAGKLVPETVIRRWPSRVQKRLFDKVMEISELVEKEDLASLEKQKAELEKRIAQIHRETDDPEKNVQNS